MRHRGSSEASTVKSGEPLAMPVSGPLAMPVSGPLGGPGGQPLLVSGSMQEDDLPPPAVGALKPRDADKDMIGTHQLVLQC